MRWWSFLGRVDREFLVKTFLDAVPDQVKEILGRRHVDTQALLSLPREWRRVYNPVVYGDFVTGPHGVRPYIGSACGKDGWHARAQGYVYAKRRGRSFEAARAHLKLGLRADCELNLRVIAKFARDIPRPYVLSFETVMMFYTRSVLFEPASQFLPVSTKALADKITPLDLPDFPWGEGQGLNRALSINQGRCWQPNSKKICVDCKTTTAVRIADGLKGATKWYTAVAGQMQMSYVCRKCYRGRKDNGKEADGNPLGKKCEVCPSVNSSVCVRPVVDRALCHLCWEFIQKFSRDPAPALWDVTGDRPCSNCNTLLSLRWRISKQDGSLRCSPCAVYFNAHKCERTRYLDRVQKGKRYDGSYTHKLFAGFVRLSNPQPKR